MYEIKIRNVLPERFRSSDQLFAVLYLSYQVHIGIKLIALFSIRNTMEAIVANLQLSEQATAIKGSLSGKLVPFAVAGS